MSIKREDVVVLDNDAVKRIMKIREYGRNSLAKALGRDPSEVGLWIRGKRRITLENARAMATVLECDVEHLTGELEPPTELPPLGSPEYYAQAIDGKWWATSHVVACKDIQDHNVSFVIFEWEVNLIASGSNVSGTCNCRTVGYEHGQFNLKCVVNGRGFFLFDGIRGVPDGVDDIIRGLMQFHSDGRQRTMSGGFVMYWPEHHHTFLGQLSMKRLDE